MQSMLAICFLVVGLDSSEFTAGALTCGTSRQKTGLPSSACRTCFSRTHYPVHGCCTYKGVMGGHSLVFQLRHFIRLAIFHHTWSQFQCGAHNRIQNLGCFSKRVPTTEHTNVLYFTDVKGHSYALISTIGLFGCCVVPRKIRSIRNIQLESVGSRKFSLVWIGSIWFDLLLCGTVRFCLARFGSDRVDSLWLGSLLVGPARTGLLGPSRPNPFDEGDQANPSRIQADYDRAEPDRAELNSFNQTDPEQTKPNQSGPDRTEPIQASPNPAKSNRAIRDADERNQTEPNRIEPSQAKPRRAKSNNRLEPNQYEPSWTAPCRAELRMDLIINELDNNRPD